MTEPQEPQPESRKRRWRTWLICLGLIALAAAILWIINSTEPVAEKETATLQRSMLVEVMTAKRNDFRPVVVETGTVAPAREIQLAPQVGGRIVDLHPEFIPGGFVDQGEVILRIEPDDYETRVSQRKSELTEAETQLALEMGRQKVAQRDFELLGERLAEGGNQLVLREPQLAAARNRVDAAEANLEQAELDLARTEVRSPFDAQILSRMADLGSQVAAGMPVANIIGIDQYWVIATISPTKLPFLSFPKGDAPGSPVRLVKRGSTGRGAERMGSLFRLIGELESNTRLARVVIKVEDPLNRDQPDSSSAPLLIGEFLEVRIEGKLLEDVVRLPLSCLRVNDSVWIMNADNKLEIRSVEPVFKDSQFAYLASGVEDGEAVITSSLSRVSEGAELRIAESETSKNPSE